MSQAVLTSKRLWLTVLGLVIVLLACIALGLTFGSSTIDLGRALSEWFSGAIESRDADILVNVRLPRVMMAATVGAGLAVVGVVFQGMLQNPLADPYILGVSGGASIGVVLAIALGLSGTIAGVSTLPAAAFIGALGSVAIMYGIASLLPGGIRQRQSTYTLLLVGIVFNAFAMAIVLFMRTLLDPINAQRTLHWLIGSLSAGRLSEAERITVMVLVFGGAAILVLNSRKLNLLMLGDDMAMSLGVAAHRTRLVLFIVSSLVVGAAVSAAGLIGFVGLVVPHALRLFLGADHRLLVIASAMGGAAFLVLADLLSRALFPLFNASLPVGAITAIVGVPLFFVFLVGDLRAQQRR